MVNLRQNGIFMIKNHKYPFSMLQPGEQSTHRLEAFFDAIYAIVMTILVLNLAIPDGQVPGSMIGIIGMIWPQLFHFGLSFYILASYWRSHHRLFGVLSSLDEIVIKLNLAILFVTCLLPFTTSLAGDFSKNSASSSFFHLNLIILGCLFWIHWKYVYRSGLVRIDPLLYAIGVQRHVIVPLVAFVALILAWVSPSYSSLAYLFIPIIQYINTRRLLNAHPITAPEPDCACRECSSVHPSDNQPTESELHLRINPTLCTALDNTAEMMQISREEVTLHILSLWEKKSNLPSPGKDRLCSLDPAMVNEEKLGESYHQGHG